MNQEHPMSRSSQLLLLVMMPVVCVSASSIYVSSAGTSPQQEKASNVSVSTSSASQTASAKAKSKVGDMLPSRMNGQVKLTEGATLRLPVITPDAMQGGGRGKGQPLQIGVTRAVSLDPTRRGKWYDLGDAGSALVLGIISQGAAQVRVQFGDADLPAGAKLFVRSMTDPNEVYGAFEGRGALGNGTFWSPPVRGEGVVIEYLDPRLTSGKSRRKKTAPFRINQISHIFRR